MVSAGGRCVVRSTFFLPTVGWEEEGCLPGARRLLLAAAYSLLAVLPCWLPCTNNLIPAWSPCTAGVPVNLRVCKYVWVCEVGGGWANAVSCLPSCMC